MKVILFLLLAIMNTGSFASGIVTNEQSLPLLEHAFKSKLPSPFGIVEVLIKRGKHDDVKHIVIKSPTSLIELKDLHLGDMADLGRPEFAINREKLASDGAIHEFKIFFDYGVPKKIVTDNDQGDIWMQSIAVITVNDDFEAIIEYK